MNNTNKRTIFFIALVIIIIAIIILLSSIKKPSVLDSLIAFIPPIILLFFYEYTENDRKNLISYLTTSSSVNNNCIILLFGISGTGKTSLATSWGCERKLDDGRMEPVTGDQSTEKLEIYHKRQSDFHCTVIDYRGQDINSLLGSRDYEKYRDDIYAVIFIADVVPREVVTKYGTKKITQLGEQYDWLMEDPSESYKKIEARVNSNFEYLNTAVLQILFENINILKLRNMYLLINKYDVIEEMKSHGVLPIQLEHEPKNKIRELFSKFENTLRKFCDAQIYPITNGLIIKFISTNDKRETDKLYNEIKKKYKEWDQQFGPFIRRQRIRF
ncbi:MAG: hypothetical protein ACREPR_09520 [Brasilonema sp.]